VTTGNIGQLSTLRPALYHAELVGMFLARGNRAERLGHRITSWYCILYLLVCLIVNSTFISNFLFFSLPSG